jgi:hypothetical protein
MKGSDEDRNVIAVYAQIKEWVEGRPVNAATIVGLVTQLIPIVQKTIVGKHEGAYKKLVVISVLELVIRDSDLDQENKDALNVVVQTTVPITIDTMVGIAKGDIDLAKHAKSCCIVS